MLDVETGNEETLVHSQSRGVNVELVHQSMKNLCSTISQTNYKPTASASICMVPSTLRNLSASAYSPCVISIGPLHEDREHLRPMNCCKHSFMEKLFSRTSEFTRNSNDPMEECLHLVYADIDLIKDCYSLRDTSIRWGETLSDSQLAEMMVIDGCFILEFLNRYDEKVDPVMDNHLLDSDVAHDLVLLENQIPFFVLEHIFKCTVMKFKPITSLTAFVLQFCQGFNPIERNVRVYADDADASHSHVLGLLHKTYHPAENLPSAEDLNPTSYSASELARAGVIFQPNKDAKWQLGMEFKSSPWLSWFCWAWGKPALKMPVFHIVDNTETFLRNLIAYELCCPKISRFITSYVIVMDTLIDTKEDVGKLVESGVLVNELGSNHDAAIMINSICKEVVYYGFHFAEQWKQLDDYYNGYWPKNIAWLRRTYFNNLWNSIALVAAIILFSLTLIQTYFTIRPIY